MIVSIAKYIIFNALSIYNRGRYFRLTPLILEKTFILDRFDKQIFTLTAKEPADLSVIDQIFTRECYSMKFLWNHDEIIGRYNLKFDEGNTPLIIDCGANIGASTLYFSQVFEAAEVIGIEPLKRNVRLARSNTSNVNNLEIKHAAISCSSGEVYIEDKSAEPWSVKVSSNGTTEPIEAVTINDIIKEKKSSFLFIVKMDIEGFEDQCFSQNFDWIDKCDIIMIELHDWMLPNSANSKNFLKAISGKDRDFIYKGETIFSIKNN